MPPSCPKATLTVGHVKAIADIISGILVQTVRWSPRCECFAFDNETTTEHVKIRTLARGSNIHLLVGYKSPYIVLEDPSSAVMEIKNWPLNFIIGTYHRTDSPMSDGSGSAFKKIVKRVMQSLDFDYRTNPNQFWWFVLTGCMQRQYLPNEGSYPNKYLHPHVHKMDPPMVIVLWSTYEAASCGKSHRVRHIGHPIYLPDSEFFDPWYYYANEETIVFDDFETDDPNLEFMVNCCDNSQVPWKRVIICITCDEDPSTTNFGRSNTTTHAARLQRFFVTAKVIRVENKTDRINLIDPNVQDMPFEPQIHVYQEVF
jgi:hypothetical protein